MGKCFIIDIDGTLADCSHRLPMIAGDVKDWDGFFAACADDVPIFPMREVCWALSSSTELVLVTGRPERSRDATVRWLAKHGFPLHACLYMRADGDHRPDVTVKREHLARLLSDGFAPIMAFEDRARVAEMWRAAGIPCAQVAEGDY